MKLKYFLRGLGIGIVFTVFLFVFFSKKDKTHELTEQEIIQKASSLGMMTKQEVDDLLLDQSLERLNSGSATPAPGPESSGQPGTPTPDSTSEPSKQPEDKEEQAAPSSEPVNTAPADEKEETEPTLNPSKSTPSPSKKPQTTKEPQTAKEPKTTKKPDTKEEKASAVSITILAGMSSEKVAAQLEKLGLVDDAKKFNRYLQKQGHEYRVRVGTFQIPTDATYEQIAGIITR